MARSWWDQLWGSPEKTNANQAKYTGPKPYASLTEFPVGSKLNETILAGLGGQGWGFGEDYVNKATSPAVAQILHNAPKVQREAQDTYSARGLGRGTAVARDLNELSAQRELDINSLLSQAYLTNEQQKKTDEANWQQRGSSYAGQEVGTRSGAATFGLSQMGAENDANAYNNALTRQYNQDQTSALNKQIGAGLTVALPFAGAGLGALGTAIGGGLGTALGQFGGSLGTLTGGLGATGQGLVGSMQPSAYSGGAVDKAAQKEYEDYKKWKATGGKNA